MRRLIDKLNEQCLKDYLPEQSVSIDESMVPYFDYHDCKQYMRNKPVEFGNKFWVAATPLGYGIQFYPYAGKDENYDSNLGLGGSVVATLAEKLPSQVGSNYHIIMNNFFTSPNLLRIPKAKDIGRTDIDQPQSIFLYNKGTGGVDRLDQSISSYMIGHHRKKWWRPVFPFCLDLSVNNVYQLYRQQKRSEGEHKLDLLGFRRSIFDTYYRCLRKSKTRNIFPPERKLPKVSDEVRYGAINHWVEESNGGAPHIRKPLYTFAKNAMLVSIEIVTSSFTSKSNLIDILVFYILHYECIIVCTLV